MKLSICTNKIQIGAQSILSLSIILATQDDKRPNTSHEGSIEISSPHITQSSWEQTDIHTPNRKSSKFTNTRHL